MNIVFFWNDILLECSRRDFTRGFANGQQPGPIRTSRAMAIVHLAIHDAVALTNNRAAAAYLNKKSIAHGLGNPPPNVPRDDVISGAAVETLKALYPQYLQFIDDSTAPANPAAFAYGQAVGQAVLAARGGDGSNMMIAGPQPVDPAYGEHRADPYQRSQLQLGPVWGNVTRFIGEDHQPLAPYPGSGSASLLNDPAYLDDFIEVRDLGSANRGSRTAEQERIGVYWGYDGANELGVPPRLYNQVARAVVEQLAPNLSLPLTAELFAEINVAMADAGIDAWHHKYVYDLWRPVVGIREEGPPQGDPFWAPLGAPQTNSIGVTTLSPGFPAYPSGHATFGAALFQVLKLALINNASPMTTQDVMAVESSGVTPIPAETFTFVSDELDGIQSDPDGSLRARVVKQFGNFAEPVWENSVSRIYLGVHWRFDGLPANPGDNIGGVPLGLAVGLETHQFFNTGESLGGAQ